MGNVINKIKEVIISKGTKYNMLLLGLPSAGKTHFMYSTQMTSENWIADYNKVNNTQGDYKHAKLKPTFGFN